MWRPGGVQEVGWAMIAAGARATGGGAEWCWWKWKARGGGGGGGEGRVRECPRRNGVVHPWVGQISSKM